MPSMDNKSKSQQNSMSPASSATPPGDTPPPPDIDLSKESFPSAPAGGGGGGKPPSDIDLSKESFSPEMRQIANNHNHLEQQKLQQLQERQSAMTDDVNSHQYSVDSGQQPMHEQNQNKSHENPER